MKYRIRLGLMVLACGMLLTGVTHSDENDTTLSDGPSRAELFQARLAAELGPLGALAAAAAPPFFLPSDVKGDAIFGIDVSHHNDENCNCKPGQICSECKIDWSRAQSQKVSFVYVKASQGTGYRDPTFGYHWRTLAQHNIARGAYHFMSADEDPIVQADWFVDRLEEAGKLQAIDLPPCLDLEADLRKDKSKRWIVVETGEKRDFWNGQEPDEILQKVLRWLKRVEERTGRAPIIYTSRGWWTDRIKDEKKIVKLQGFPIWIANYPDSGSPLTAKPKVPNGNEWAIWQFTESGRVKEAEIVPGNLDINIFNGTMGDFPRAMGIVVPEEKQVVRVDERNDTSNPPQQVGGANPGEPAKIDTPPQQVGGGNPGEPAKTDTPPQQVGGGNAGEPAKTDTPPQQVGGGNAGEPAKTDTPPQQVGGANPGEPAKTDTPPQQVGAGNAGEPAKTDTPPQQVGGANPGEPAKTDTPPQQVGGANPGEPVKTDAPPQQVAAIDPNDAKDAGKPAEQSANPGQPGDTGKPADQPANVNPKDSKQNTGTSSPRTNSTSRSQRNSSRTSSQRTVAENSPKPAAEKTMVEIVLVNGRTIRVDANIDPAMLSRLITAVDGN